MANVKLAYRNILETATVTSTDENSSFPLYRLYDRDIGKLFKFNTHGAGLYVKINQSAIPYNVSRLIIPATHNLNGLEMEIQNSPSGAFAGEEVHVLNWTQADALIINKSFVAANPDEAYWRFFIVSDPATPPEMPEIFLTADYTFERNVKMDLIEKPQRNVDRDETKSGYPRWVKLGEKKRYREYELIAESAQKANLESWWDVLDSVKPFYIFDHNGALIFMEVLNDLSFTPLSNQFWITRMEFLEVP
jgi:hypothetical protein